MSKEQARCSQEARLRMARELGVRCWQGSSKEGLVCIKHSAWLAGEAEGFHVIRRSPAVRMPAVGWPKPHPYTTNHLHY